jgi:hypothetical protein
MQVVGQLITLVGLAVAIQTSLARLATDFVEVEEATAIRLVKASQTLSFSILLVQVDRDPVLLTHHQ